MNWGETVKNTIIVVIVIIVALYLIGVGLIFIEGGF